MTEQERPPKEDSEGIDPQTLPESVLRLMRVRRLVDPSWDLSNWMAERAEEELSLLEIDLERELRLVEQRRQRLDSIANQLAPPRELPRSQKNLFDDFGPLPPRSDSGTETNKRDKVGVVDETIDEPPSPAGMLSSVMPKTHDDDPLIALTAQLLMYDLAEAEAKDEIPKTLKELCEGLEVRGINAEDAEEALNLLLDSNEVWQVEPDQYILGLGDDY